MTATMTKQTAPRDRVALVTAACRRIEEARDGPPALAFLAAELDTTPDRLRRAFEHVLGLTPHQYADGVRLGRFRAEVREGTPVTVALFGAGYGSTSRLYEDAGSRLGMTPASYGAGGRGAVVAYAIVPSRVGWLCVGTTEWGICHVGLADTPEQAEADLGDALHSAVLVRDDAGLAPIMHEMLDRIDGHAPHRDLPVDVRGTAFQRRVWQELQRIPTGETRSYAEIAAAIGMPRAARAVGQACGANPVAIVVPCHRVVRSDGDPGHYGWGPRRKRALLEHEASRAGGRGQRPPTSSGP